jgi:acyl-CoA thioesterase FadM
MQEIASQDAENAQLSGNGYWVVKRTTIDFSALIPIHTKLELKTYGMHFTRITALRGYEARLAGEDQPIVTARTLWVYIDARGRPIRLPEETAQIWLPDGSLPPPAEIPFPPLPEQAPATTSARVRFSDLDLMLHLNNAATVEILDNAAWEVLVGNDITPATHSFQPLTYDIEYAESPRFGEHLEIQSWLSPLPAEGQPFSRTQQISRAGKLMVRAHSRWAWQKRR